MIKYMENTAKKSLMQSIIPAVVVFVLLGGFIAYGYVRIATLSTNVSSLTTELASTTAILSLNTKQLSQNITDLGAQATGVFNALSNTQQNIDAVKNQVGGVEQTVGNLQKLAQTDPQILKKYSKVYFMNENYTPAHLTIVPTDYIYSELRPEQFLTEAWPFLKNLFDAARGSGIKLYTKSAYRSFGEQKALKSTYSVVFGAGTANSFSADQGYSEHQLGTTIDFITSGLGGQLDGFDGTQAFTWLQNNAYRYGFELSYPKDNSYYVYEPWHWRFVGIKLATYLHDNNLKFYNMDQREIDKYLAGTFD